jgi:hypothetical protein
MRDIVSRDRALLERAQSYPAWSAAGQRVAHGLRLALMPKRLLASPIAIIWLVSLIPAVAYLIAGGFPATSGLQRAMRGTVGLGLLVVSGLASAVLLTMQLRVTTAALRGVSPVCLHEARVRPQARILTAAGGLLVFVPMLWLAVVTWNGDRRVVENYHALDALGQAFVIGGLALFVASLFFFPPFALAMTELGPVLVSTVTSGLVTATATSGLLAGVGVMLSEAAEGSGLGSGGGSPGSSGAGAARQQRIEELAGDPAHGGRITPASRAEAEVGAGLEESGQVQGLRRSQNAAEEFIDGSNNRWDVKGFHSEQGRFNLDSAMRSIWREMNWSKENIMLDTRNLSTSDLAQLRQAIEAATARGELPLRVLWWP